MHLAAYPIDQDHNREIMKNHDAFQNGIILEIYFQPSGQTSIPPQIDT